jgi:hypothetical protein
VHHGSPVLMLLLAGRLGLLIFVLIAGALWWAVPRLLHQLRGAVGERVGDHRSQGAAIASRPRR